MSQVVGFYLNIQKRDKIWYGWLYVERRHVCLECFCLPGKLPFALFDRQNGWLQAKKWNTRGQHGYMWPVLNTRRRVLRLVSSHMSKPSLLVSSGVRFLLFSKLMFDQEYMRQLNWFSPQITGHSCQSWCSNLWKSIFHINHSMPT